MHLCRPCLLVLIIRCVKWLFFSRLTICIGLHHTYVAHVYTQCMYAYIRHTSSSANVWIGIRMVQPWMCMTKSRGSDTRCRALAND